MPAENFEDDAPEKIFRLVMVRLIGKKELRWVNIFSSLAGAANHRHNIEEIGGQFVQLTRYKKAENHDFENIEAICGFSEVVPYSEPYPNA